MSRTVHSNVTEMISCFPPFSLLFREKQPTQAVEKRPKEFKKDGNICRLRTQEDSEEDNNTWNGNSTQQM